MYLRHNPLIRVGGNGSDQRLPAGIGLYKYSRYIFYPARQRIRRVRSTREERIKARRETLSGYLLTIYVLP